MKCPHCSHVSDSALLKCTVCDEVYDRETLEEFQHVLYLLDWLEEQREVLGEITVRKLSADAEHRRAALQTRLLPPAPEEAVVAEVDMPEEAVQKQLVLLLGAKDHVATWILKDELSVPAAARLRRYLDLQVQSLAPSLTNEMRSLLPAALSEDVDAYLEASVIRWIDAGILTPEEVRGIESLAHLVGDDREAAQQKTAVQPAASADLAMDAAPAVRTQPTPPPVPEVPSTPEKPREPLIQWDRLWERMVEAAVSGLLLRWLRYLGAFLFVVSLAIVVINFWDEIPESGQVLIIFFVPTAFYTGGWVLRNRMQVVQTGGVLMGVGQILLAIDFAAIYQFGGLTMEPDIYWLITSAICTIFYLLTILLVVRAEFFGYIGLVGIGSTVAAGAALATRSVEWPLVSVAAVSVLSVEFGYRLGKRNEKWAEISEACLRFPIILIPIVLLALLLVPTADIAGAQFVGFLLGTFAAGLLAMRLGSVLFTHVTVWFSALTTFFLLRALGVDWVWYPSAGAAQALIYAAAVYRLQQGDESGLKRRRAHLLPFQAGNLALLGLAAASGVAASYFDLWPGVIGLGGTALALAGSAVLLQQPLLLSGAAMLFFFPLTLASWEWLDGVPLRIEWLAGVWIAAAGAYIAISAALRKADRYVRWLVLWVHIAVPVGLAVAAASAVLNAGWPLLPLVFVLGGAILVYFATAWMHGSGAHPAAAFPVVWLPDGPMRRAAYLWPAVTLMPVWLAVTWRTTLLADAWLAVGLAVLAIGYAWVGRLLKKKDPTYQTPFHMAAYAVAAASVLPAWNDPSALMMALFLDVGFFALMAIFEGRVADTAAAGLLFVWPFSLGLNQLNILPHIYSFGYVLLACLGYIPLAEWIRARPAVRQHSVPVYWIGYGISVIALALSLAGRFGLYFDEVRWVGVIVPFLTAALYGYSAFRVHPTFRWAAPAVFAVTFWQLLDLVGLPSAWHAAAWVGFGAAYLLIGSLSERASPVGFANWWARVLGFPLRAYAWVLALGGLVLTLPFTMEALLFGLHATRISMYAAPITAQWLGAGFVVLAAVLGRNRLPLFLEPWLTFLPATLMLIGYGETWFGMTIKSSSFGILWGGWGALHVLVSFGLDHLGVSRGTTRSFAAGLYLGGYLQAALAVFWAIGGNVALLWSLGTWILLTAVSAGMVHFRRQLAWAQLQGVFFKKADSLPARLSNSLFIWLAALPLPVWVLLLLAELPIVPDFEWLAFGGTALVLLGVAVRLRRVERVYGWPLILTGQVYTAAGLLLSGPFTLQLLGGVFSTAADRMTGLAVVLMGVLGAIYYAGTAYVFRKDIWGYLFAFAAALLAWVPYTLSWIVFRFDGLDYGLGAAWAGFSAALLAAGLALDAGDRRSGEAERTRISHGVHFAAYLALAYAVLWTWPDRFHWLITAGAGLLLALVSHWAVHTRRHGGWLAFASFFFSRAGSSLRDGARSAFLWIAAVGFPVWLTSLLAYQQVPWAWRGLALALAAPVYVAAGLWVRRVDPAYSWPLYITGYVLTAVGAMVSFDDTLLAIYVLSLNALVYAVSAYIFRRPVWLYLTTVLVPVIAVVALQFNLEALPAPWLTGIFMGLAYVYFAFGQWFDRGRPAGGSVHPFALPFYSPGFLLSAIGLAVATDGRELAILAFLAGVALYALSAWRFREAVFLYPAVWLTAVPYYLALTYTRLDPDWYGLAWLPLIAAAFFIGRRVFQRRTRLDSLAHPAMPFYILVYALSVSMVMIARGEMLALAISLAAAGVLYAVSARVFRSAFWVYPALLAGHLSLAAFAAVDPLSFPLEIMAVLFLPVTALVLLTGVRLWSGRVRLEAQGLQRVVSDWALPFLAFGVLDVVFWQAVSLVRPDTALIAALGHAIIVGSAAVLLMNTLVVLVSLGLATYAIALRLVSMDLSVAVTGAAVAGTGFALYLLGRLLSELAARLGGRSAPVFRLWAEPVSMLGIGVNSLGVLLALGFVLSETTAAAAALAFAGAVGLAEAYRRKWIVLGYGSVAVLEAAYALLMFAQDIRQPQWYAIPAGLYFTGVAYFERRQRRVTFANLLESFGLIVMLLTTFGQSLDRVNGFWYFLLLLLESLLVIAWAAQQRRKVPFLIGAAGSVANVVGQIVIVFLGGTTLIRWLIFGSVGLLILMAAIYAERWVIPRAQEMRERLEAWS